DLLLVSSSAKTDAEGRYEIRGARKSKAYMVEVGSDAAAGYMACQGRAVDPGGYEPATINLRVARGVVVTGRGIDKATGKGVPGFVMVAALNDNPFVKDYPEFGASASLPMPDTDADGRFRVVTIPGPVILMGGPDARRAPDGLRVRHRYKPPAPDPNYP